MFTYMAQLKNTFIRETKYIDFSNLYVICHMIGTYSYTNFVTFIASFPATKTGDGVYGKLHHVVSGSNFTTEINRV